MYKIIMKIAILFFTFLFPLFANATIYACSKPVIVNGGLPEKNISWELIDDDDDFYGIIGKLETTIDDLKLRNITAIVGGNNEKESDYIFPIKMISSSTTTDFHFYVKRDLISNVKFSAIYISGSDHCPDKLMNYEVSITHNKSSNPTP